MENLANNVGTEAFTKMDDHWPGTDAVCDHRAQQR